jgi:hypothetical protein
MHPPSELTVKDISNVTEPMTKRFLLNVSDVGTDSCLWINFTDPHDFDSQIMAFGNNETCIELWSNQGLKNISLQTDFLDLSFDNPLEIDHTYSVPGNYVVHFRLGNQLSNRMESRSLTVMEIDCRPPVVSIKNPAEDFTNGTEFWKSRPIQLYAKSFVDCNATSTIKRYWTGFRLDPKTGVEKEKIDLTSLDSYKKTFLYIPPFFLGKGIYRLTFNVEIISPDNSHPLLPFSNQAHTHISVVPSPIIGQMTDGAQSRIIRGWGQKVRLAPGLFSVDPDNLDNKNFKITWFCRRLPGETIDRNMRDEDQIMSAPLDPNRRYPNEADDDNDVGGCFGLGPGRINMTGGEVNWNTKVFFAPAMTYEIIVRIDPPDREPSWTGIQLFLLERSPPSIKVKCQTAALCYPHVPIGQKINPVRVGLVGLCSEDCDGSLTYEWSMHGVKSDGTSVWLQEAAEYVVGENEEKMALGIDFFKQYYPTYMDFFAKLSVTNEEGDRGESDIFLHINQPPEGGECFMTRLGSLNDLIVVEVENSTTTTTTTQAPKLGQEKPIRALLDKIQISCNGWMDPEFKPIEYYAFWIQNKKTDTLSYLMYGPDKESEIILPYGNFTLGVDVKDKEGALTRINVSEVSTVAPTRQEYNEFMNNKVLENADAAGDQSLMNMVSQAVTSLMNIKMYDYEEEVMMSTTTTTTTTTTTNSTVDKIEWLRRKREKELREAAETRAMMVKSVESIMNMDTLNSLEQIGSVLTAIAGKGKGVDNEAKEVIIRLLNKTVSLASTIQVESPQQLLDFCMFAVGSMGGIVNVSTPSLGRCYMRFSTNL